MPIGVYKRTAKHIAESISHLPKNPQYWKGKKFSKEHRRKLSENSAGMLGKKHTKEAKRKMSISKIGKNTWSKGRKVSNETKRKISESRLGEKHWNYGKKLSIKTRKKMSVAQKGEKSHLWRGGITKANVLIRCSLKYRLWRQKVFERDDYTCVFCKRKKEVSGKLNADHIKPFADYPKLRFDISNGRTLCIDCHESTPTYLFNYHKIYKPNEMIIQI